MRVGSIGGCLAVVAASGLIAACGSSSGGSSTSAGSSTGSSTTASANSAAVKEAQQIVDKMLKTATSPFTLPPLPKRPEPGKTVVAVTCSLPVCHPDGLEEAAAKLNWKYKLIEFDPAKGPQAYVAAWEQALQAKPDYIMTVGIFPPSLISKQLAEAQAQNIPVVGVVGESDHAAFKGCANCEAGMKDEGAKLADVAIAGGGTGDSTLALGDTTNLGTVQTQKGVEAEFARLNLGKPHYLNLRTTDSHAQNASAVVNYIQSHPQINTVITTISDLAVALPRALTAAGLADKVKYHVAVPQIPDVDYIKSGSEGPAVITAGGWWSGFNDVVKLSVGEPAGDGSLLWVGLMTKDNADQVMKAGGSPTRPEPPNFKDTYYKSWLVE